MLKEFIENLKQISQDNFPEKETTKFFKSTPILVDFLSDYLFFSEKHYTRNLIYYSDEFELVAVCWLANQKAPAHGHEGEKCWARVEKGKLYFVNYDIDKSDENIITLKEKGATIGSAGYLDGPAYIHSVANNFDKSAVSLHLYAKPFHKCRVYKNDQVEVKELSYFSKFGKLI